MTTRYWDHVIVMVTFWGKTQSFSFFKNTCEAMLLMWPDFVVHCVIPEIFIHVPSPWKGFFLRPPPCWKFQLSFIQFFKSSGFTERPTPRKFQSLSSIMDIFWDCTFVMLLMGLLWLNFVSCKNGKFSVFYKRPSVDLMRNELTDPKQSLREILVLIHEGSVSPNLDNKKH